MRFERRTQKQGRAWAVAMGLVLAGCASRGVPRSAPSPGSFQLGSGCAPGRHEAMSVRLELFVADLSASVDFYTRVLGFTVERESSDYVAVCRGGVVLGLGTISGQLSSEHYFQPEVAQLRKGLGVEIVLEVDDVEAAQSHVRAVGHPLLAPLERQPWGLTDFRLADPDGYYLRVTSRQ